MNRTRLVAAAFALAGVVGLACSARVAPPAVAASPPAAASTNPDSANFDVSAALRELEASIKGRENAPAESVWKNIQGFKGMPAGRLLRVMETGFSKSLGVDCLHCHVATDWASDDKRPKRVAREMMAFSRAVNSRLKEVPELASKEPAINCTTCHRGAIKPALNL
jgi:hypothetical protein